jgi:uncharacterized membrane protein
MDPFSQILSASDKQKISQAIKTAELNTSGEIRVHIESKCKINELDRAAHVFSILKMHQTELRNGVLIYLAFKDRKFAIIGDAGINAVVPDDFWESTKELMKSYFLKGEFAQGIIVGIDSVGEKLKQFFPYQTDDKNELSDEISFGK